ncbi:MAG: hypothetical protein WB791_11190 [Waddliaceae bacterium]
MVEPYRRFAGSVESVSDAEFIFLMEIHNIPEHRKQEARFLEEYADPTQDTLYLEAPTATQKIEKIAKSLFPEGNSIRVEGWNDPKIYELEKQNNDEIRPAYRSGIKLRGLVLAKNPANPQERIPLRENILTFINNGRDDYPKVPENLDDRTLIERLVAKIETSKITFTEHHFPLQQQYLIDTINKRKNSRGKKFIVMGRGHFDPNDANGLPEDLSQAIKQEVEKLMKCLEKTPFIAFSMG